MIRKAPQELPQRIVFFLVPKFSLIAFTSAVEPLRLANREAGKKLYSWNLVSVDDQPVLSSCGIPIAPDINLDELDNFHAAIICSGEDAHKIEDRRIHSWLRRIERKGVDIGALCTGAHILAKAGLLDDYSCTIHWENLAGFLEDFPEIEVTPELFEIDRNRFTCAGGTASLDMMLNIISSQYGHELAGEVANQFMHDRIRDEHDQQRMSMPVRLGVRHPKLLAVIKLMEDNTALSKHNVRTEIDRYIAWPAQALSYKLGEIKIWELRRKAEKALGSYFDIRHFHDALLAKGPVPLGVLEQIIDDFIDRKKEEQKI